MAAPQPSTVPPSQSAPCACGYDLAGLPMTSGLTTCPECGRACRPCPLTYGPSGLFRSMAYWPWLSILLTYRPDIAYMLIGSETTRVAPLAVGAATCIAACFVPIKDDRRLVTLISIVLNALLAWFLFDLLLPRGSYAH